MGSITAAITMTITETGIIIATAYLEGEVVDEVEVGVINQLHYEAVVAITAIMGLQYHFLVLVRLYSRRMFRNLLVYHLSLLFLTLD